LSGASRSTSGPGGRIQRARWVIRWVMASFYIVAGLTHIALTDKFLLIVPNWVPFPRAVVLLTGFCEIAGGAALLSTRLRRCAGIMLALYAICVFPANIKHAIDGIHLPPVPDTWWYHGPRLAFQPVLVWWALFCAGVIDWPFQKKTSCGTEPKKTNRRMREGRNDPEIKKETSC
jgi:uncharacterized membrane protein